MNRIAAFLLVSALIVPSVLEAEAQEGRITYDRTVKIEIDLPPEMESMRDQIPTENTTSLDLFFSDWESMMRASEEQEGGDSEMRSGGMVIRMSRPREENITYINHDEGIMIDKRDFMQRTFLINDDAPLLAWKLTGEQSEFMGYTVQKATAMRDSSAVEAWFAPEIPTPIGPGPFGGLPGAILVLSVDEGQMTFTAKEVDLSGLGDVVIEAPTKGRKVSQEEFDAIVEEKRKEMEAQFGSRGGNRIMIRN